MPSRRRLVPLAFQRLPIRWKLAIVSASLTFVILLIFGGIVGEMATSRIRSDFNRDLQEAATRLVSKTRIVERPFSEPSVYGPSLAAVSLPTGATARVVRADGTILDEAPKQGPDLGPPSSGIGSAGGLTVATEPVYGPNNEVVGYIQYGRSDDHVDSTVTRLWLFIVFGILGGTALAVLAGVALARRAMRPIATLTSTAREIATTRDPARQLPQPSADDEVAELSRTLQEMLNALNASQTEREAAMQKQREFVADASHELRTPLTSILANLELLEAQLGKVDYGEERELASSAVRSSQRMSRLVSDLLILARSDAGQTRPQSDVDLAEIAMSAGREIAPSLGERSLHVDCEPAPVHGNQDELHRLVLNLLDNAARYSPEGAEISLATRRDRGTVLLEVADSGPGIPEEMRERVFERFVRGQSSSDTAASNGTGLGLAMVRAIAASHGGRVSAERCERLGGARLVVALPALQSPDQPRGKQGQPWRRASPPPS
ncbi:MAG TPA: HAMP domain-containing sensor histidine kinase [Solirubrobacterales bacterium]|nr:HAMP domain-containing sensor histidine kinase [Solirubrobacterales bacterium]